MVRPRGATGGAKLIFQDLTPGFSLSWSDQVAFSEKDGLPIIAALNHVMREGGHSHTRSTGHGTPQIRILPVNWLCYAYCLMDNHYHLLIQTPDGNLSKGMRQLNIRKCRFPFHSGARLPKHLPRSNNPPPPGTRPSCRRTVRVRTLISRLPSTSAFTSRRSGVWLGLKTRYKN